MIVGAALVVFVFAFLVGIATFPSVVPPRALRDRAYTGAFRWAENNLPKEGVLTTSHGDGLLKSEVVSLIVNGEHAWAAAYYGCDRQRHSVGDYCRRSFPGTGYIIQSSNLGATWEIRKQISNWCPLVPALKFVTEMEGYAIGDTGILYTSDSGKTWNLLGLPSEIKEIRGVVSIENWYLEIYCNADGERYESFDRGRTWRKKTN
jgi:photosystem II stability/assembly factor-like uncharacterized protein